MANKSGTSIQAAPERRRQQVIGTAWNTKPPKHASTQPPAANGMFHRTTSEADACVNLSTLAPLAGKADASHRIKNLLER